MNENNESNESNEIKNKIKKINDELTLDDSTLDEKSEEEIKELKIKLKFLKLSLREQEEMDKDNDKKILPKDRKLYEISINNSRSGYVTNRNSSKITIGNHNKISK